ENFNRLMEEIKSVTDQPVKYVINTHHHPDHVGNNQKFIDAGAQVVALEALKMWMEKDPRTTAIPGRPSQTFPKDYTLKLADAEVRLYSFGRGHTGDDTMVYFPDTKIVMVSDQITDATPIVDFANGGSAVEWTKILDGVLSLDFEQAIPGRGEPKSKADIQAYRSSSNTSANRAAEGTNSWTPKERSPWQVKPDDSGSSFYSAFSARLNSRRSKTEAKTIPRAATPERR